MNIGFSIPDSLFGRFQLGVNLLIGICVATILIAVALNFAMGRVKRNLRRQKKSMVATGTMLLFLGLFMFLLKTRIGYLDIQNIVIRFFLSLTGLAIIILGTVVNLKGRLTLGENWANQIKIYQQHRLVTRDVYRIVRHPLYASTLWMFYGACLVQVNWFTLMGTTTIFLPMMVYRARQEENLLIKEFAEYQQYRATTGMFFPKIFKGVNHGE